MAFTYFFRDLQTLEMICKHSLPELQSKSQVSIWDAGCAMGPEPYTLAMLLSERIEYQAYQKVKIFASDIDGSNLFDEIIKNAVYPKIQVERIPQSLFESFFIPDEKEGHYKIIEEITKIVSFQKHDLLSLIPIGHDFGLILCKNVLLHFSEAQRIEVIKMFYESLCEGGFLAMEQTQKLPAEAEHLFERVVSNAQLYRKKRNKTAL